MNRIKQEYSAAKEALLPHVIGPSLEDDPGAVGSLNSMWSAAGEWVASHLQATQAAAAAEIPGAVRGLDPELEACAADLGNRAYAVSVAWHEIGTFFVVAPQEGTFHVVWAIKDLAKDHYDRADEISSWAAASATFASGNLRKTGNGPLYGCVHHLPPDEQGHPRFYMQATYSGNGVFLEGQLSIWEWTGAEAVPLVIKNYPFILFESGNIRMDGDLLRVCTDVIFKSILNGREVDQPQGEWMIRLTPKKVEDLGVRLLVPEIGLIDDLYDRVWKQVPADDITSAGVIAMLSNAAMQVRKDPKESLGGILSDWQLFRSGRKASLCMETDQPGRVLFTIVKKQGRLYIADAKDVSDKKLGASCAWVLAGGH